MSAVDGMDSMDVMDAHLNVSWLRPEQALWDTIASRLVGQVPLPSPSLDLGAGNGIFSFLTAGGAFSEDYDWYRNVNTRGFWEHRDIYDCFVMPADREWIRQAPARTIDYAADLKMNLLHQAAALRFYRGTVVVDASQPLPFTTASFGSVFSNMLYWLPSPQEALAEVARILRPGGRAVICFPNEHYRELCISYQWKERNSELLRLLNRGRAEAIQWTASLASMEALAKALNFRMTEHRSYLSPLTLRAWDIGVRPLSAVLIKLVGKLTEADRREIKREWIETMRPFLREMCAVDATSGPHGFHLVTLER